MYKIEAHTKDWEAVLDTVEEAVSKYSYWLGLEKPFTIHLHSELWLEGTSVWGFACPDDHLIRLSYGSLEENSDPLEILAHEMIHLGQFETEALQYSELYGTIWRDTPWTKRSGIDMTELEYRHLPWEKQAFIMQTVLRDHLYDECGI